MRTDGLQVVVPEGGRPSQSSSDTGDSGVVAAREVCQRFGGVFDARAPFPARATQA
jgi:hypothetical protein